MCKPINRSPLRVTVSGQRKLDKKFPVDRRRDDEAYANSRITSPRWMLHVFPVQGWSW